MKKLIYGIEITFPDGGMRYTDFYYKLSEPTKHLSELVKQIEEEQKTGYKFKILELENGKAISKENCNVILDWEF